MQDVTIAFIGGGNMASSLLGGLVAGGFDPSRLWAADPDDSTRERLSARLSVHTTGDNHEAVEHADVVVFAVKPQLLRSVTEDLAPSLRQRNPLVISIAAGVRGSDLQRWLGGGMAVVRTMPNTPALVQSGATGLYASPEVSDNQRELAESILRAAGLTLWVEDESLMDAVTALSGSGPAYFFLFMEALEEAAVKLGLKPEDARLLTLQTAFGAAKMALESDEAPAVLRERVTSPGGTTERAVATLEEGALRDLLTRALESARDRSVELSRQLGAENE